MLDKLTYAGREENLHDVADEPALPLRARRDRGPARRSPRRSRRRRPRRSSTSPPRRTSTARSPSPTRSCARTRSAPTCCWRPRASDGAALRAGLDRRGVRLDRGRHVHRGARRCAPPRPTRRRRRAPTCSCRATSTPTGSPALICRGSNNYGPYQYPEKLIPLMILNALHGDPLPVYGDGMQVRNWIHATDFARAIGHVLEHGAAGRGLQRRRARRAGQHRRRPAHRRADGRAESQIEHVTDRPGHDRRYSLSSEKVRALGWAPRVRFEDGLARDRRLVPRERLVVGADPLGRLSRATTNASTAARSADR